MNFNAKLFLACGALSAAISVALGAAGAHALANLPELSQSAFRTALQYQQFHALGLLAVGLIAGTLLFGGNLYLRTLAGIDASALRCPGAAVPGYWAGSPWP